MGYSCVIGESPNDIPWDRLGLNKLLFSYAKTWKKALPLIVPQAYSGCGRNWLPDSWSVWNRLSFVTSFNQTTVILQSIKPLTKSLNISRLTRSKWAQPGSVISVLRQGVLQQHSVSETAIPMSGMDHSQLGSVATSITCIHNYMQQCCRLWCSLQVCYICM